MWVKIGRRSALKSVQNIQVLPTRVTIVLPWIVKKQYLIIKAPQNSHTDILLSVF
jgi:hypothetical protein